MHAIRSHRLAGVAAWLAVAATSTVVGAADSPDEVNVLSWDEGAEVVQSPPSEATSGQWSPEELIDELPDTGWANARGDLTPKVLIFQFAAQSQVSRLVFDTAQAFSRERSAKDVIVEISDRRDGGFVEIGKLSLVALKDGQELALKTPMVGRYLKLTVLNNWGDSLYMEIMNFKAYGKPLVKFKTPDVAGTFSSSYGDMHLAQQGSSAAGCYHETNGLIENGGFEGRVLRFTWNSDQTSEKRWSGPAVMIFSEDGQSFRGHFWHGNTQGKDVPGEWNGKRVSRTIGACPNWKPDGGNEVEQQLKREGRARLYGILFDTDSDRLKEESKPTLESLVAAARNQPSWRFEIEGHTDNIGTAVHNQELSEKRAASVKAYLVKAGIDAQRLSPQGFGATRPVGNNDTSLGRSQNRRVEVVNK